MNDAAKPPFRAEHVGSLVRPPDLLEAVQEHEAGRLPVERLAPLQDRHIRDAVRLQEEVGLQAVTDGEFRRRSWQRGFMDAVDGFTIKPSAYTFRNEAGVTNTSPAAFVTKKVRRTRGIVTDEFKALAALTSRTPKVTIPAPTFFHFGLYRNCVDAAVYPDIEEFFADLIAIYRAELAALGALGCRYLQIDEVALAALCDPKNREIARSLGEDPDAIIDLYFRLNQAVVAARPPGMTIAMHVCRGNQAGLWMAEGGYEPIAERLFGDLDVDAYFLEYDSPRAGDFAPLRHVPAGKRVMLGLISTKRPEIEDADGIRRKIDDAARYVPLDRLGLCPQCGFASSISRWNVTKNPMTIEIERAKLARTVEIARAVWQAT